MRNHAWSSLRRAWFIASAALFVVVLIGLPTKVEAIGSASLISLTNNQRAQAGLTPLAYNGNLASSAYAKARDMLAKGYWAHTSPDGLSPWTFVRSSGYAYVTVGENLARDFSTDTGVIAGWMASPGHRANILKPEFRDIGIAVVEGSLAGAPTTLVVAHYGSRAATAAPAPAAPAAPAPKRAAPATAAASTPKPATPKTAQQSVAPAAETAKPVRMPEKVDVREPEPLEVLIKNLVKILRPEKQPLV